MPVDRSRAPSTRNTHRVQHQPAATTTRPVAKQTPGVTPGPTTTAPTDGFGNKPATAPTELPIERTSSDTPRSGVGGTGALRFQVEAKLTGETGAKAPPAPEVALLMTTYGVDERLGRPRERMLAIAARLQTALAAPDALDRVVDPKQWGAIRSDFFALEGLLRLYRKEYGKPIEKQLTEIKEIEDKLGALDYFHTMQQLSVDKNFPAAVQDHLAAQRAAARSDLVALVREQWSAPVPDQQVPGLAKLIDTLADVDWQDYKDDRKTLRKALRASFEKVGDKEFDLFELQGNSGLHELRRSLRWIGIQAPALGGLVAFDETRHPIREFKPLLDQPVAQSKFAQLPTSEREDAPLTISRSLYVANTDLIDRIGKLKNEGEAIEGLAQAYFEAMSEPGAKKKELKSEKKLARLHEEAESKAMQLLGAPRSLHDIESEGNSLFSHLQEIDYFEQLAAEFEKK